MKCLFVENALRFAVAAALCLACCSCKSDDNPVKPDDDEPEKPQKSPLPEPFTVAATAFSPDGGHIQGIAASDDALYLAQAPFLTKVKWGGRLVRSTVVTRHTGDLCWYGGELFAALAVGDIGKIQVYDKDLTLKRECEVDHGMDGITCMDGILYVGMGSKTEPSSEFHRVNVLGRFDAITLEEIAPRADFDYGYQTRYGFQDMTNDGKYIYATFYVGGNDPQMAVFDKDLKLVRTEHFDCSVSNGIDLMPEKFRNDNQLIFIKCTSHQSTVDVSCSLDYWYPSL